MTGEEVDRSIKALFDHQAQLTSDMSRVETSIRDLTVKVDTLADTIAVIGNTATVLTDNMNTLTGIVTGLALQADADRAEMRNAISQLATIAGNTSQRLKKLEEA
jgi:hypothetical protein